MSLKLLIADDEYLNNVLIKGEISNFKNLGRYFGE